MSDWALFINGIYETVLEDISAEQSKDPGLTLFLQPYSGSAIARLRGNVPSPESPVTLYASTTDKLDTVRYMSDIVGWEDKTAMTAARQQEVTAIIEQHQTKEGGLYFDAAASGAISLNLLHVRRMVELQEPFSVARLIKLSDSKPLSTNRSRSGGYSYVRMAE